MAKIGFIGMGNMGTAILKGALREFPKEDMVFCARTLETKRRIYEKTGVEYTDSNAECANKCKYLILAVKPQFFQGVIEEIRDVVSDDVLVISIAAGKTIAWIEQAFHKEIKLVRCMPNTPALVGEGCTGVCVNSRVSAEETALSLKLMESFGRASLVPESLMDAVGAVSGSSPAFVFMFIEAMADAAVAAGMPRAQAYEFAAQAVYGSSKLVLESGKHPGELKDMVCSPGGTTIQGVRVLEENGMRGAVIDALRAVVEQTRKL